MQTGTACQWNSRGFGFIKPDLGGEDVFCHVAAIRDGNCLRQGDTVEFCVRFDTKQGKYRAEEVTGGYTHDPRYERYDRRDRDRSRGRDRGNDRSRRRRSRSRSRSRGRDRDRDRGDRDRDRDRDRRR